jgi:hypothetical protein
LIARKKQEGLKRSLPRSDVLRLSVFRTATGGN